MNSNILQFPSGFLWGTATAAHQVEGNNIYSDWWEFEELGKTVSKEKSGIAVDHYNRFQEDVEIAKSLHQNAHRFSIEWARVEPEEGNFQIDEIMHYKEVIKAIEDRGMQTMVTLLHFTLPKWVAKQGGWTNKKTIFYFTRYIEQVLEYLGDDVDFWITMNEPVVYTQNAYLKGRYPPGVKNVLAFFRANQFLARAHREAYFTIHKFFKSAVVGIAKNIPFIEAYNKSSLFDKLALRVANWIATDRFLGRVEGLLDFLGVQYYNHLQIRFNLGGEYFSLADGYGIEKHKNDQVLKSDIGWEIYPEGIYHSLMRVKRLKVPIIVTENGVADRDDKLRAAFIHDHLLQVHRAINDGVDVRGYFHWTLMDNYEWHMGRNPRFGLVEIDYENNLLRKIRQSAYYFAEICKNNSITV